MSAPAAPKTSGLLGNPTLVSAGVAVGYSTVVGASKEKTLENAVMAVGANVLSGADPLGFGDGMDADGKKTDGILMLSDDPKINAFVRDVAYGVLIRVGSNAARGRSMTSGMAETLISPTVVYAIGAISEDQ